MVGRSVLGPNGALLIVAMMLAACGDSATVPVSGTPTSGGATTGASTGGGGGGSNSATATPGGGASAGDACALVTKAEVAAVVGFDIATVSGGQTWGGTCVFQGADPSKLFNVTTYKTPAAMAPMLQIESGALHVDGVGTDAFWAQGANILFARNGDHAVAFQAPDLPTSGTGVAGPPPDTLVQMAKAALGRLG